MAFHMFIDMLIIAILLSILYCYDMFKANKKVIQQFNS